MRVFIILLAFFGSLCLCSPEFGGIFESFLDATTYSKAISCENTNGISYYTISLVSLNILARYDW